MDYKLKNKALDIITESILTPIIYLLEDENQAEFICFCDEQIEPEIFTKTQARLEKLLNTRVVILDIREYDPIDRLEIVSSGEVIYTANPVFEKMFAISMTEDIQRNQMRKSDLIKRYNSSGSVYLQ